MIEDFPAPDGRPAALWTAAATSTRGEADVAQRAANADYGACRTGEGWALPIVAPFAALVSPELEARFRREAEEHSRRSLTYLSAPIAGLARGVE